MTKTKKSPGGSHEFSFRFRQTGVRHSHELEMLLTLLIQDILFLLIRNIETSKKSLREPEEIFAGSP
ncbi:MAG: hypothetical protein QG663_255 [Thermodesulfobacteriota bacterium]|nr:hypothetical protein [Thermodesulfobacteriota bacterium]